jgi:hypothetical protein
MDRKFYPLVNLFLDLCINPRLITMSEALSILCRRYGLSTDEAKMLFADAITKRWFTIKTQERSVKISSISLRGTVTTEIMQKVMALMSDGIWRSPETIAMALDIRVPPAADVCLLLEAISVFDSRMVWPKEIVYATIRGAEPILYSPDFTLS